MAPTVTANETATPTYVLGLVLVLGSDRLEKGEQEGKP